jgi:hypothetical protein
MRKRAALIGLATVTLILMFRPMIGRGQLPLPRVVGALSCRHDDAASPADRARRDQARALARAINAAEGRAVQSAQRYVPLNQLPGLPMTPAAFEVRLYTDGNGYVVSLKDTIDPCHYGVFTDQHGLLYEVTPQRPLMAS